MERFYLNGNDWEMKDFLGEDWIWRNAEKRNTKDIRWWRKGEVPGSVTNDLYKLSEIPDPYFERNSLLIEWVPERTWIYRKKFLVPKEMKGKEITLTFEGVDYEALFFLNETYLGTHASMYTPVSFEVASLLEWEGENQISVVLQKAPDEQPQVSKTSYVKTHKSRMTYWWDFCPRMIHVGIWDDVYLEAHGSAVVEDVFVRPVLSQDHKQAELLIKHTINSNTRQNLALDIELLHEGKQIERYSLNVQVFEGVNKISDAYTLSSPKLWWPNGSGTQPLYELKVSVLCNREISHEHSVTFGIRDLSFEANEDAEPMALSYALKVNGKKVYVKGWNWVPMDVMYGVKRTEKLRHLLTLAKEANVNMLRVWGGGLIEREDFYQLCDEYGILVWQEFIQSSSGIDNQPSQSLEFISFMEKEAEKIIPRKRNHASLAIWCGGNELQSENQSMIKDTEPVIQALARAVAELDPDRKFLASSPTGRIFNNDLKFIEADPQGLHDVHGPWEHQGLVAQYTLYNKGTSLFSSEYGVEGMTNYNTLEKSMDKANMWPPSRDNIIYFHRGSWWNNYILVQECFDNRIDNIEAMIRASQFLQYEGLRYAVESNRRRAFHNSGSMMWQFNEPYPNNYCTCSVDYYGQPKPAYYGIRKAYEETALTAQFEAQSLFGMENFKVDIYGHNSQFDKKEIHIRCRILGDSGKTYYDEEAGTVVDSESKKAFSIKVKVKELTEEFIYLVIEGFNDKNEKIAFNKYFFTTQKDLSGLLEKKENQVELSVIGEEIDVETGEVIRNLKVTNLGRTSVTGLKLELQKDLSTQEYAYFSYNYLYLLPGESQTIEIRLRGIQGKAKIAASGFAVKFIEIEI